MLSTLIRRSRLGSLRTRTMASITPNVSYDTVAREWRMKWSADADKASLSAVQDALTALDGKIKAVKGLKKVQRVVCGGCLDFKVSRSGGRRL